MSESRTINSTKNIIGKTFYQLLVFAIGFFSRKVFIVTLGIEYLGVSGLFSSILDMLSLAELGIGAVISVVLYKPLAENDEEKVYAIMKFCRKIYSVVAIAVLTMGVILIPLLPYLVKGATNEVLANLTLIYLLYLLNSASSYLFIYKTALLISAQKEYKVVNLRSVIYVTTAFFQIVTLLLFRNFFIYLVINITSTFLTNVLVSKKAENEFSILKQRTKFQLSKEEKRSIFINIRAYFMNRLSSIIFWNSNNIIVSTFISVSLVGLRSNYSMVISQFSNVFTLITSSLIPSIGNFVTTETNEKQYFLFKNLFFFSFWFHCFAVTGLFVLVSPLIIIWLGKEYVLSMAIVGAILFDIYLQGVLWPISAFKQANGIFVQGMYRPLIMSILNIALALVFVKYYGMLGVFLASILARLATESWFDPWLLFKIVFPGEKLSEYFWRWISGLVILVICCTICYFLYEALPIANKQLRFLAGILICTFVPNTILFVIFRKTEEFNYYKKLIGNYMVVLFSGK